MTLRRWFALALLVPATGGALVAGEAEDALAARWQGAWVILETEVYSDCGACASINTVEGGAVASDAVRRFDPGELGRVREIEVGKRRIDARIDLVEPLLVGSPRAGFVLYQERTCSLELRIEVPREAVKGGNTAQLEARLEALLERLPHPDLARSSPAWNRRVRGAYPADYAETRARFEVWREEWAKRAVTAASKVAYELIPRSGNESSTESFAEGVASADPAEWGTCDDLVDLTLPDILPEVTAARGRSGEDGYAFAYALKLLARLRECGLGGGKEPPP